MHASHGLLLRVAGWIPDETLARCRAWLAEGNAPDAARAVAHAVLASRVAPGDDELMVLRACGVDGDVLAHLAAAGSSLESAGPPVAFAPTRATAERARGALLTGARPMISAAACTLSDEPPDAVEAALVAAASGADGLGRVRGVWRAWRFPSGGAPWPPPQRVFVVETAPDADPVALTEHLQRALAGAGELPRVEVYPTGLDLPDYQFGARSHGMLLWAAQPDPGIRVASVFDRVDADGVGRMAADHPRVAEPERGRLLAYLRRGEPLLAGEPLPDPVDPESGQLVPVSLRTDGSWIWSQATTFYLDRRGLAPDPELVEHIRARDYRFAEPDGVALYRAGIALARSLAGERSEVPT